MKEKNIGLWIVILLVIILAGSVGLFMYAKSSKAELTTFEVDKANKMMVANGVNLGRVEVWLVPTGTNITPDSYTLITSMAPVTTDTENQRFVAFIPDQPLLATKIFAKAFDKRGREIGTKELPYVGATEIHYQLWGIEEKKAPKTYSEPYRPE